AAFEHPEHRAQNPDDRGDFVTIPVALFRHRIEMPKQLVGAVEKVNLHPRKVRSVIEYRKSPTGGMLCSHSSRDGPRSRYIDCGSTTTAARCQAWPAFRRQQNPVGAR